MRGKTTCINPEKRRHNEALTIPSDTLLCNGGSAARVVAAEPFCCEMPISVELKLVSAAPTNAGFLAVIEPGAEALAELEARAMTPEAYERLRGDERLSG